MILVVLFCLSISSTKAFSQRSSLIKEKIESIILQILENIRYFLSKFGKEDVHTEVPDSEFPPIPLHPQIKLQNSSIGEEYENN